MLRIEGQMETQDEQPEVPFSKRFAEHPASGLGEPVIKAAEQREYRSTHERVVEVRHYEIRIRQLPVQRRDAQHDAGEPGDEKLEQERDTEQHGGIEADVAAPHGA